MAIIILENFMKSDIEQISLIFIILNNAARFCFKVRNSGFGFELAISKAIEFGWIGVSQMEFSI